MSTQQEWGEMDQYVCWHQDVYITVDYIPSQKKKTDIEANNKYKNVIFIDK